MLFFRLYRSRRVLYTIFCFGVCLLRTAITLQSSRFLGFGRKHRSFDSSYGSDVCNIKNNSRKRNSFVLSCVSKNDNKADHSSRRRRDFLLSTTGSIFGLPSIYPAQAIDIFEKKGFYVLNAKDSLSESSSRNQQVEIFPELSSEYALLRVLPVKNTVFRTIEQNLEGLSVLRETTQENIEKAWTKSNASIDTALTILVRKRNQLEAVINPDDSAQFATVKVERGQSLLSALSDDLQSLKEAINQRNMTCAFEKQRSGLLNLGFLGELLVKEYPYKVPDKGKYSFLPRLLGRAQVTFRFKRNGIILGNVKILADGYVAPITAGNFIDLCIRNFYTGLPVQGPSNKSGLLYQEPKDNLPINILGSFNEGFYDPLTGQLRQIPLEVIFIEGTQKLSYTYSRRFLEPDFEVGEATVVPAMTSKPLLTFEMPGLVGFNHPIGNPNGGSSEFFGLQSSATKDDNFKRSMLDGHFAPFGYIIDGFDVFDSLKPGDTIDSTSVDDFGQLNLVKIRSSTFKEVAQGTEEASAKAQNKSSTSEDPREKPNEGNPKKDSATQR